MNNKCKRLGNRATKAELREAHRVKMMAKEIVREHNSKEYGSREYVLANISQHHEHYGDKPQEHEARKKVLDNEVETEYNEASTERNES